MFLQAFQALMRWDAVNNIIIVIIQTALFLCVSVQSGVCVCVCVCVMKGMYLYIFVSTQALMRCGAINNLLLSLFRQHCFSVCVQSDTRTQEEILAFFASHVSAVKNIYSKTEFRTYDRSMKYIGVDFVVQRTSVSACVSVLKCVCV